MRGHQLGGDSEAPTRPRAHAHARALAIRVQHHRVDRRGGMPTGSAHAGGAVRMKGTRAQEGRVECHGDRRQGERVIDWMYWSLGGF